MATLRQRRACGACIHVNADNTRKCAPCMEDPLKPHFLAKEWWLKEATPGINLIQEAMKKAQRGREEMRKELSTPRTSPTTQPVSAFTKQEGGDHYSKLPIQPFQYSMANKLDPMQHTIIKYVTRFRDKGGLESLRKAIHTLELLIEHEYGANQTG